MSPAQLTFLFPIMALSLAGCWTLPNANVQPGGEPRLIQSGITVVAVKDHAAVEAVDAGARTITLKLSDTTIATYKVGAAADNFARIQADDQVKATVTEELAVYLPANDRLPGGATAETMGVSARVLKVDPSYRLLTLQYPDGRTETFKSGLEAKLVEMAPGDTVVVQPREAAVIRIQN
ncbi:MAG: hypothetical protein ACLQO1_25970 [Steroidobacteraceae bacterium]